MKKKIIKIQSLKGKKSPCWVKVKFDDAVTSGTKEYAYGIAYYAEDEKAWYIFQNVADGSEPNNLVDSALKYSWIVCTGSVKEIKNHDISELYILPRKPRTKEFENISLKFKEFTIIDINHNYKAIIFKGHIKVGCQEISNEIVRTICRQLID